MLYSKPLLIAHCANMPEKAPASLLGVRGRREKIPQTFRKKHFKEAPFACLFTAFRQSVLILWCHPFNRQHFKQSFAPPAANFALKSDRRVMYVF